MALYRARTQSSFEGWKPDFLVTKHERAEGSLKKPRRNQEQSDDIYIYINND